MIGQRIGHYDVAIKVLPDTQGIFRIPVLEALITRYPYDVPPDEVGYPAGAESAKPALLRGRRP